MQIDREELLSILEGLKPGLAKKNIVEQMKHFMFTGDEIITFNDKVLASYPYSTDFSFSIDAEKLFKLLSRLNSETIDIELEGNALHINSKNTRAGINTVISDELTDAIAVVQQSVPDDSEWKELPSDFIDGIELCSFSADDDETKGTTTCVGVFGNTMFAGDRNRVSRYEMTGSVEDDLLIKKIFVPGLLNFDYSHYALAKSWIHFITEDGMMLSIRRISGKFLPYETIFDSWEGSDKVLLPKEEIMSAMDALNIIAEGEGTEKWVGIKLTKDHMEVFHTTDNDWIERDVDVDYKGSDIEIYMQAKFLIQVLGISNEVQLGESQLLFTSEKFSHLVSKINRGE